MSGAADQTLIDIIGEVSTLLENEVAQARGEGPGWSFLASTAYGVQVVTVSGAATGGTFTLTSGASTTSGIAPTATASDVQSALDTILGSGNSVVTGAPGGPWTVTFAAALSGPQPVLVAASSLVPSPQTNVSVQELVTGSAQSVTRRYTGRLGGTDLLLIDDAISVSSVAILDPAGNTIQTLTAGTDYLPYPLNGTPIVGLLLTRGWWPWTTGSISVTFRPGYATAIPNDASLAAIAETIRNWRAGLAGEDDRLGMTPFGSVVVSKALLQSSIRMIQRYRIGAGFQRSA